MKELFTMTNIITVVVFIAGIVATFKYNQFKKKAEEAETEEEKAENLAKQIAWDNAIKGIEDVDRYFKGKPGEVKKTHWIGLIRGEIIKRLPEKFRYSIDKIVTTEFLETVLETVFPAYKKDQKELENKVNEIQEGLEKGE